MPSQARKLLVHLSNFRPVKRVTDVVEIFAQVTREIPAACCLSVTGRTAPLPSGLPGAKAFRTVFTSWASRRTSPTSFRSPT